MKRITLLLLFLGAGCAERSFGAGAANAHPPPLPLGVSVPKWDHFCSDADGEPSDVSRFLDDASENGWEMVSWTPQGTKLNFACFKRPHVAAATGGPSPTPTPAAP